MDSQANYFRVHEGWLGGSRLVDEASHWCEAGKVRRSLTQWFVSPWSQGGGAEAVRDECLHGVERLFEAVAERAPIAVGPGDDTWPNAVEVIAVKRTRTSVATGGPGMAALSRRAAASAKVLVGPKATPSAASRHRESGASLTESEQTSQRGPCVWGPCDSFGAVVKDLQLDTVRMVGFCGDAPAEQSSSRPRRKSDALARDLRGRHEELPSVMAL